MLRLKELDLYDIVNRYCYAKLEKYLDHDTDYVIDCIYDDYAYDKEDGAEVLEHLLDRIDDLAQDEMFKLYKTIEHKMNRIVEKIVKCIKLSKLKNIVNGLEIEEGGR